MNEILLALGGGVGGLIVGGLLVYLLPCRNLQQQLEQSLGRATHAQMEYDRTEKTLGAEREQWRRDRGQLMQEAQQQQESLQKAETRIAELNQQLQELTESSNSNQEKARNLIQQLQAALQQAKQHVATADQRMELEISRWKKQLQNVEREKTQIQAQLTHFQKERNAEVAAKLDEHRDQWEQENMGLRIQLSQLQAERAALEQRVTNLQAVQNAEVEHAPADGAGMQVLQQELENYKTKAEQEKAALEEEIEQLMERLVRVQSQRANA